jgi:dTDP-glucose pyrophosphorylase
MIPKNDRDKRTSIDDFIVSESNSVYDVMSIIDANSKGIALVCDGRILKAAVSDGDIRRYIINNGDLSKPISEVANYSPKYCKHDDDIDFDKYFVDCEVDALPILNCNGEVISIKFIDNSLVYQPHDLNIPVVIMAGGKGERLAPYTNVLPKPLIPINEKTITEHIMERFEKFGCTTFNMIVNYKKNLIKTYFEDDEVVHNVSFTDENVYCGTGGGLKLLEGKYTTTFFMTNCDILVEDDYHEIYKQHKRQGNIITIVSAVRKIEVPYGTINLSSEGYVESLDEKPTITKIVNTGFYVIEPNFIQYVPEDTFIHITEVIEKCIASGEKVGIYPISEKAWFDMGQITELENMQKYIGK